MFLPTDITLSPGDSGDYVQELQRRLAQRQLLSDGQISAFYDGSTEQAVRTFQMACGIEGSGIATPATLRQLHSLAAFGGSATGTDDASGEQTEDEKDPRKHDPFFRERANLNALPQEHELMAELSPTQASDAAPDINAEHKQKEQAAGKEREQDAQTREADAINKLAQQEIGLRITRDGIEARTVMEDLNKSMINQKDAPEVELASKMKEQEASLKFTRQGMEARTPMQELENRVIGKEAGDLAPDAKEAGKEVGKAVSPPPVPSLSAGAAPAKISDPALAKTEAALMPEYRQMSRDEGQSLSAKGVSNQGEVAMSELGNLSPARSPSVDRSQSVGIG